MSAEPAAARGARPRYRFASFVLSPGHRQLLREGRPLPLIPRYLDLLLLLVERRHEAVTRQQIMDVVWSDVVVSDGALSQAVRTLRRALGDDDPREPRFIRTVSRHGYQFVCPGVAEENDEGPLGGEEADAVAEPPPPRPASGGEDLFEPLLDRLLRAGEGPEAEDDRRAAAEGLHALGTAEALRRLDSRPGHAAARALLRDARWDVPGAGAVPLLGEPGALASVRALVGLRFRRALRAAGVRFGSAAAGAAAAGTFGGLLGGVALTIAPDASAPPTVIPTLALVGSVIGAVGGAGVGAGIAVAEALARSARGPAVVALAALGGGAVGVSAQVLARWTFAVLFGHALTEVGGGREGLVLGAAAGLGYALSTPRPGGGMATPHGGDRVRAALVTGVCCGLAALAFTGAGGTFAGASLHALARGFTGSQVGLTPLARLFGEREMGALTRAVVSSYEGLLFGCGFVLGLTRAVRPPGPASAAGQSQ